MIGGLSFCTDVDAETHGLGKGTIKKNVSGDTVPLNVSVESCGSVSNITSARTILLKLELIGSVSPSGSAKSMPTSCRIYRAYNVRGKLWQTLEIPHR